MKKAIALIRTSTTHQEIEEQKRQVLEMCAADGLTLDEVEIVGGKGLSAIKMDDKYMQNINKVYNLIETNPSIKCVYAWAIDRIGRNDLLLTQFRVFLVQHKVQLKIRAQGLSLLNPDGSENFGVKIQFNLYATLAEAEMENKKARMLRGRYANREKGKFNGGKTLKYGYSVDARGFYIVNEEEAKVIRLIFDMLNDPSKRYTLRKVTAELQQRGITIRGKKLPFRTIATISRDECYIGGGEGRTMPRIISDELFHSVGKRLSENIIVAPKSSRHHYFGNRIIKCANCGYYMTPSNITYRCNAHVNTTIGIRNKRGDCEEASSISIQYADAALWIAAMEEYRAYVEADRADFTKRMSEERKVIGEKINEALAEIQRAEDKKKRIAKIYVDGVIGEKQYDEQVARVNEECQETEALVATYREKIADIDRRLSLDDEPHALQIFLSNYMGIVDKGDDWKTRARMTPEAKTILTL